MKEMKDEIAEGTKVKAYYYGRTIEITNAIDRQNTSKVVKGHRVVNLLTGEVADMNTNATKRSDNLTSVRRTMRSLRRLIGANFGSNGVNRQNQLWITLTYAKNVNANQNNSTQQVYYDFKSLMKKLRHHFGHLEYIAVLEPQGSGRWHLHVLLKAPQKIKLYIPNTELEKLWGKGFTSTKRLRNSDNVAGYVMAYVSDLDLTLTQSNNKQSKKYIKGARLSLYPKGVRIYRRSKGIKEPRTKTDKKYMIIPKFERENMPPPKIYVNKIKTKSGGIIRNVTEFYEKRANHTDQSND